MLLNRGDKRIYDREVNRPSKEHFVDFKLVEKSMKAFPRKKEYFLEKYMDRIKKNLIRRNPSSPPISAISVNDYYKTTLTSNTYYNTQNLLPTLGNKFAPKNTEGHNATRTSFFSVPTVHYKTVVSSNNDDLSYSKI